MSSTKANPPPVPSPAAPPAAPKPRQGGANATPQSLVAWIARQQQRGNVERYELRLESATTNPRFVDDYDAKEGGGAAEQLADLIYARAIEDSENAPDLSSVYYGVQAHLTPGLGLGSMKRFSVPQPTRVEGRPLEPANETGLLAIGMRGLNKATEAAQLFVLENARQMGDGFESTQLGWKELCASAMKALADQGKNFSDQLEWKNQELTRLRDRNVELEQRSLETFKLSEEVQSTKHQRDLEMLRALASEERKTGVANNVIANVLPFVTKRLGTMLGGPPGASSSPPSAASSAPAAPPAESKETPFSLREQFAIQRFLACLTPAEFFAIQGAIKGTPAGLRFDELVSVLHEEAKRRDDEEAAAAAATNGAVNGAAVNGSGEVHS
jgi:hypothetical protein